MILYISSKNERGHPAPGTAGRKLAVKWLSRLKKTLNAQLVTLSVALIVITVLIAMGSSLWLDVYKRQAMGLPCGR